MIPLFLVLTGRCKRWMKSNVLLSELILSNYYSRRGEPRAVKCFFFRYPSNLASLATRLIVFTRIPWSCPPCSQAMGVGAPGSILILVGFVPNFGIVLL